MRIRSWLFSSAIVFELTLSTWVNILAIFAVIIASGYWDISSKLDILSLKPAYVISKSDFTNCQARYKNEIIRNFENELFDDKEGIIVDCPRDYDSTTNEIYYRNMTNGDRIYKYALGGIAGNYYEDEMTLRDDFVDSYKEDDIDLRIKNISQKRGLVSMGFIYILKEFFDSHYRIITTDTINELMNKFPDYTENGPTGIYTCLHDSRKAYSIISVENNTGDDIYDIQLNISKKYHERSEQVEIINLEAWTFGEANIVCKKNNAQEIIVNIANLKSNHSIQLIASKWSSRVGAEDINVSFNKLKSLNKATIFNVLLFSFLGSLLFATLKQLIKPNNKT